MGSAVAMDKTLLSTFIFSLLSFYACAQTEEDTAFVTTAQANTRMLYNKLLGGQSRLFNGSRYVPPKQTFEQHPYFLSEDWITGSLFYDGEYFHDVPLMYDLASDVLITEHFPSGHPIRLVPEKLDHFSVDNHFFEKIINDSVSGTLPGTGFYEVLYQGESKVVASRSKFLREKIEGTVVTITYEEKNRYFILRNGVFFPVRSKGSVLKLMDDRRQELKKYLKQKKIVFSDNRERALKTLAEHYDNLR